ncbi:hypothetical protein IWX49DRAFT_332039 [Phyllosticta citricarpa]|uniref:Uncharacterized protein n=1 Tax=Phyllosticta citricarpa TaxID=55181 RepID=A0ABR1L730_9PEZI
MLHKGSYDVRVVCSSGMVYRTPQLAGFERSTRMQDSELKLTRNGATYQSNAVTQSSRNDWRSTHTLPSVAACGDDARGRVKFPSIRQSPVEKIPHSRCSSGCQKAGRVYKQRGRPRPILAKRTVLEAQSAGCGQDTGISAACISRDRARCLGRSRPFRVLLLSWIQSTRSRSVQHSTTVARRPQVISVKGWGRNICFRQSGGAAEKSCLGPQPFHPDCVISGWLSLSLSRTAVAIATLATQEPFLVSSPFASNDTPTRSLVAPSRSTPKAVGAARPKTTIG